jgi:hypothetical protein
MIYIILLVTVIIGILAYIWVSRQLQNLEITMSREQLTLLNDSIPVGSVPHPTQSKHHNNVYDQVQHNPDDTKGEETHPDHPSHKDNQGHSEPPTSSGPGSIKFGMKYAGDQLKVVDGIAGLNECIDLCQGDDKNVCTAASINMPTGKCTLFKTGKLVSSRGGDATWVSQPVV